MARLRYVGQRIDESYVPSPLFANSTGGGKTLDESQRLERDRERRAKKKLKRKTVVVGDLRMDAKELALAILQGAIEGQATVWADHDQTVWMSPAEQELPTHWIIGVYLLGTSIDDVERDIVEMRQTRMRDWIMD